MSGVYILFRIYYVIWSCSCVKLNICVVVNCYVNVQLSVVYFLRTWNFIVCHLCILLKQQLVILFGKIIIFLYHELSYAKVWYKSMSWYQWKLLWYHDFVFGIRLVSLWCFCSLCRFGLVVLLCRICFFVLFCELICWNQDFLVYSLIWLLQF